MSLFSPFKLLPQVMKYDWGKAPPQSLVWQCYVAAVGAQQTTAPDGAGDIPWAELWLGAHKKAPAQVMLAEGSEALDKLLSAPLPWLFKVLSVDRALSIQVHPNEQQAIQLHANKSQHYPDPHEKKELALAISELKMLYGVKDLAELRDTCEAYPELNDLIGQKLRGFSELGTPEPECLADLWESVVNCPADLIAELTARLGKRLSQKSDLAEEELQYLVLARRYSSGDCGVFCALMMRFLTLAPFDGVWINPGTLHAYLEGDLLEFLTNSDNVVRAGLTGKFKDPQALIQVADFAPHSPLIIREVAPGHAKDLEFTWFSYSSNRGAALKADFFVKLGIGSGESFFHYQATSPGLLFVLDGTMRLKINSGKREAEEFLLGKGESILLPAGSCECEINASEVIVANIRGIQ